MNICSRRHDEVCYDQRFCPMCELVDEIDELERKLGGQS